MGRNKSPAVSKSPKAKRQKENELRWLRIAQEKCPTFPRSNPEPAKPPAPDIIFRDQDLGVEVTRFFHDRVQGGSSPLRALESERRRIVNLAKLAFEESSNERLFVIVMWTPDLRLSKHDQKALVPGIASVVRRLVARSAPSWVPDWSQAEEVVLGSRIGRIWVDRRSDGPSHWCSPEGGSPGTSAIGVREAIRGKEAKVNEYRRWCQELWLLIVAEPHFSSMFERDEEFDRAVFQTSFDRVFILDAVRGCVHELRIHA